MVYNISKSVYGGLRQTDGQRCSMALMKIQFEQRLANYLKSKLKVNKISLEMSISINRLFILLFVLYNYILN